MPFPSALLVVTAVLTFGAFLAMGAELGPGLLLYVAMLGGTAGWLLPGLVAQALPLGLFGGALLTAASRPASDRLAPATVLGATVVVSALCLGLTGWLMPEGYRATAAAAARFTGQPAEQARAAPPPSALDLPALVAAPTSAARAELRRRLLPVAGCGVAGLVAGALLALGLRLRITHAMIVTLALFITQMVLWIRSAS